jgi:hypothetical protein
MVTQQDMLSYTVVGGLHTEMHRGSMTADKVFWGPQSITFGRFRFRRQSRRRTNYNAAQSGIAIPISDRQRIVTPLLDLA